MTLLHGLLDCTLWLAPLALFLGGVLGFTHFLTEARRQ